ncbi:hypothetical protein [Pyxidicoccus sp. MSG2]|uniref:hypothetical protein n=1 Tax=Pyxidicoccus sp. MSG2 TaxID=2996790 RepID=UPI00226DD0DF|nr:hypothetical protein [Pyxidicoccus sp. MSG2]MCY1024027.1 hypothetical protein [Pyxidicoccus sp. MSG2]
MFNRKLVAVVAIGGAFIIPQLATASGLAQEPRSILQEHHIASVRPYKIEEHIGKLTSHRIQGAEVYVEAEPGLTAEWLRLKLARHLDAMRSSAPMPDCPLDVADVRVEVASAGAGFTVKVIAADSAHADEVLRRARLLLE